MNKILEALAKLDVANDNHWTGDGLPRIDTVRMLVANPGLGRDDITKVAPDFSRQNPVVPGTETVVVEQPVVEQPVVAQPVVAQPVADENAQAELKEQIEAAMKVVDAAMGDVDSAQKALREAQNKLDDLITLRESSAGTETNMDAIQSYLKSQQGILVDRARRTRALRDSGVTIADIQALIPQAAPIDAALRQKR